MLNQSEIDELMSKSMYITKKDQQEELFQINIQGEFSTQQKPDRPQRMAQSAYYPKEQLQSPTLKQEFQHKLDHDSLQQFVDTIEIQFCLTSPATRLTFTNTKQVRNRQTLVSNTKKIWLENQIDCVHSMFDTKTLRILVQSASNKNTRQDLLDQFHCNDLQGFVRIFCQLPEVRDSLFRQINNNGETDKYGINAGYSELIVALQEYIKESNEYKAVYESMGIADSTERYLSGLIYEKVFPKEPTARDIELNMRIKTLEWINDDHLEIKQKNRLNDVWQKAAELLQEIDNYKNSVDKLNVLLKTTQLITDTFQTVNNESSSADVVFPIVIKILITAKLGRLQNVSFIELFINKSRMMSESGYCFTQIKSAILWLESVDNESLKMEKQQFDRLVYEKEVKYNMIKQRTRRERVFVTKSQQIYH